MAESEALKPDDVVITVQELAWLLALTPTRVNQLVKDGTLERAKPGKFDLATSVRRYVLLLRGRKASDDAKPGTVGAAQNDLIMARAAVAKLDADVKLGRFAAIEDFGVLWDGAVTRMKQRLLAIPSKVAPLVAVEDNPNTCAELIEEIVHEALAEIANARLVISASKPGGGGPTGEVAAPSEPATEDDDF